MANTGMPSTGIALPLEGRSLSGGMSLFRVATGDILEINDRLGDLREEYPSMVARGAAKSGSFFGIPQLISKELNPYGAILEQMSVRQAASDILEGVPSLSGPIDVTMGWVETSTDRTSGTTFIDIMPTVPGLLRVAREHYGILSTIHRLVQEQRITKAQRRDGGAFGQIVKLPAEVDVTKVLLRTPGITVAHLPGGAAPEAIEAALAVTRDYLASDPQATLLAPTKF